MPGKHVFDARATSLQDAASWHGARQRRIKYVCFLETACFPSRTTQRRRHSESVVREVGGCIMSGRHDAHGAAEAPSRCVRALATPRHAV